MLRVNPHTTSTCPSCPYLQANDTQVTVSVEGYSLTLPMGFPDFATLPDCSPTALASLAAALAGAVAGLDAAAFGAAPGAQPSAPLVTCSYGGASGSARRRALLADSEVGVDRCGFACPFVPSLVLGTAVCGSPVVAAAGCLRLCT